MMHPPPPHPPLRPRRRFASRARQAASTAAVLALSAGLVVLGREALATRAAAVEAAPPAPAMAVAPARIEVVEGFEVRRRFAGEVEPAQETALAFEASGTLAEILVEEGARVAKGAVLARLDARLLLAERDRLAASRAALEAQAELARRTSRRQESLRDRGFASEQAADDTALRLSEIEARLGEIDAGLRAVAVRLGKAVLVAPFEGAVGARLLDTGAVAEPGRPVVTLLERGRPARFRAGLDPRLAAALAPGDAARVEIDGAAHRARLAHLAPGLDPATRTRAAVFELDAAPGGPAPAARTTGEVVLTQRVEARGAWVPLAALRQGPRGSWTLLTVEGTTAGVEAAEVIHAEGARAFVRGTFEDGALFLPDGAHRVVPGQAVAPVAPEGEGEGEGA